VTTTPPPPAAPPPAAPPPGQWAPPPAYPVQKTNGLAIAALVLGIVSFFCLGFVIVIPILAIIFGHVALGKIAASQGAQKGRGLAIAGLVLGWVFLVPIAIASLVWLGYGISNL
jgi:hypothetical protein